MNFLKAITLFRCLFLLMAFTLASRPGMAQFERGPYTGTNSILVRFEGPLRMYDYASKQLLVRYNKATERLECVLPVASLLPINDSIPPALAYHTLFGAKYPELLISIHLPDEASLELENMNGGIGNYTASIELQGVNNETRIPVAINKQENTIYFSTNFDLMLDNFDGSIPVEYLPLLTGRLTITIDNAQWIDLPTR